MKREEIIREYEEAIALDMYQDMTSYIERHKDDIQRQNRDYYLLKVFEFVLPFRVGKLLDRRETHRDPVRGRDRELYGLFHQQCPPRWSDPLAGEGSVQRSEPGPQTEI